MVVTPSQMVPLGSRAPDFALPDTEGDLVRRSDFDGQPLLVAFICNHCPYVKHVRAKFAELAGEYMDRGMAVVGISSNDADAYPDDAPDAMWEEKETAGYPFAYLYDESQATAKAYRAACTPDFFVYDSDHRLVYRGQMDDSRPSNGKPVTGADLTRAVAAVLKGEEPPLEQHASAGCDIKWKPGNAPSYSQ